jgi:type VI secretion system protein ImpH
MAMAAADGREGVGLSERLAREPYRFDFFQAVRLLELSAREGAAADPRRPCAPVGQNGPPDSEHVRFRAQPTLGFPPAPVSQIRGPAPAAGNNRPAGAPEAVVTFHGMTGPLGALPQHYTTLVLRRVRAKDFAFRDFLDLFNHRALSLFFRAWEKYRLPWSFERARHTGTTDPISQSLFCLTGFGTGGLRGRQRLPDQAILFYAGHLAHSPRSAVALEAMLADYFGLPVEVQQAQGQWLTLDDTDCSCLPGAGDPEGCNNALGVSVFLGERVWDVQGKFRMRVGPLRYSQFRQFMPDGGALEVMCQLARTYAGPHLDFDVLPVLRRDEAPRCRLGGDEADGPRLGWNTWVHDEDYRDDLTDAVFFMDSGTGGE